ncbi:golgin subfamily A member 6-like protein 26 [Halyomorpha halys]|uniref:golgin subfamily A member 6-like protein 26 n=1 Tax=Halyomorpha halys TaxID=286706 RepID=UPI0034D379E1
MPAVQQSLAELDNRVLEKSPKRQQETMVRKIPLNIFIQAWQNSHEMKQWPLKLWQVYQQLLKEEEQNKIQNHMIRPMEQQSSVNKQAQVHQHVSIQQQDLVEKQKEMSTEIPSLQQKLLLQKGQEFLEIPARQQIRDHQEKTMWLVASLWQKNRDVGQMKGAVKQHESMREHKLEYLQMSVQRQRPVWSEGPNWFEPMDSLMWRVLGKFKFPLQMVQLLQRNKRWTPSNKLDHQIREDPTNSEVQNVEPQNKGVESGMG